MLKKEKRKAATSLQRGSMPFDVYQFSLKKGQKRVMFVANCSPLDPAGAVRFV